ncbi:hypothetical protein SUGI_0089500 [Cryptomeria japonica]|nr:hypothetical protein SUGI_0089500 [Cryptomeria japonica]
MVVLGGSRREERAKWLGFFNGDVIDGSKEDDGRSKEEDDRASSKSGFGLFFVVSLLSPSIDVLLVCAGDVVGMWLRTMATLVGPHLVGFSLAAADGERIFGSVAFLAYRVVRAGVVSSVEEDDLMGAQGGGVLISRFSSVGVRRWVKFPYPLQWGTPTFNAGHTFGMMAPVLVFMIESTAAYLAASKLASATPPPAYVLSRGIGWQGIGILLDGLCGTGTGSTVSVENVGLLVVT